MTRVLVIGCNGQDGQLLARNLQKNGYCVYGVTKSGDEQVVPTGAYTEIFKLDFTRPEIVESFLPEIEPSVVFHLASVNTSSKLSTHGPSFMEEKWARAVQVGITENVLSVIDRTLSSTKFLLAGSSRMYSAGGIRKSVARESAPNPSDSYGNLKAEAHALVVKARERGLNVGTAILFNHESELRKEGFLFPHLADEIAQILNGNSKEIRVMDADSMTDWHAAQETVEGLIKMAEKPIVADYVFASGESLSVRALISEYFREFQESESPTVISTLPHPNRGVLIGDISDTTRDLDWSPNIRVISILDQLIRQRL